MKCSQPTRFNMSLFWYKPQRITEANFLSTCEMRGRIMMPIILSIPLITCLFFITALMPATAEPADESKDKAVMKSLLGTWSGKAPDGSSLELEFRKDGSASMTVNGKRDATKQFFRIKSSTEPMRLDLYEPFVLNGVPVDIMYTMKAIFLLKGDKLTLSARWGSAAKRPTRFEEGDNLILFRKK